MKMKAWVRAALAAFVAICVLMLAPAAQALPRPETFTLANGMQVVVITDRRAPVVTHMVWYRVGSADEPRGKSGIAHFLEHLMFKGTRRIPPGEFSKIIARNGGEDNAFTNLDYTAYYQRIARDRLELVMGMEADRMTNLVLDNKDVLSERDVIVEERRQRTDNVPGARLREQMMAALFRNAPYGIPIIGWLHEIEMLDRADALAFYKLHYAPNNAILVVAGDINATELRPLAERIYGRIPARANLPKRVWTVEPPQDSPRRVSLSDPKVRQPAMSRFYVAVSYSTAKGLEPHALEVAMEVLGGSETSRLYRELVEKRKLAVSVSASANTSGIGGGIAAISAVPADGVTLEQLEAAVDEVVAEFLRAGPTEAEVTRAKSNLSAAAIYARDDQENLANIFGASLMQGQTIDQIVNWGDDIMKVTPQMAADIARRTLVTNSSVTGWLLPEKAPTQAGDQP
jgi:zinc protease